MSDLKTSHQNGPARSGNAPAGDPGEHNQGAEFGTSECATRGSDRDLDRSGGARNQGHGHPREERGATDPGRRPKQLPARRIVPSLKEAGASRLVLRIPSSLSRFRCAFACPSFSLPPPRW